MKHSIRNILSVAIFIVFVVGCVGAVPIQNIENVPIVTASGNDASLKQVEEVIKRVGIKRGWIMKMQGKGHIVGTLFLRKHMAEVDIIYDTKSYSINYKDSKELNYAEGAIHPSFNKWVAYLDRDIKVELSLL